MGKVERYTSLQAACEAAVTGEVAHGEMYERLLGQTRRADLLTVLRNLQEASLQRQRTAWRS